MHNDSPLRYPGGKARVADFIRLLMHRNGFAGGEYYEPFAGGASVALSLLFAGDVERIHLNDLDPGVYAFWNAVLNDTDALCRLIERTPITPEVWDAQRRLLRSGDNRPTLALGFATFFLNRTNRSGIIATGGMIGGKAQAGTWKLDARFPRQDLIARIRRIAAHQDRVCLTNLNAGVLVGRADRLKNKGFWYLDPPYYVKGRGLYRDAFDHDDHILLAATVRSSRLNWLVSYDNAPEIRAMYAGSKVLVYDLRYTARDRYDGQEVMFFSPGLVVPRVETPVGAQSFADVTRQAPARLA